MADDEIQTIENNSSLTIPIMGNEIRIGDVILFDEKFPCRVTKKDSAKPGKHGSAKVILEGVDIFTNMKHFTFGSSKGTFQKVVIMKTEYQLIDIEEDGFIQLLTDNGTKDDIKLPDNDLGKNIIEAFKKDGSLIITILNAMNKEMVVEVRKEK